MILQKFVFPCYFRTTHKHCRPGNHKNWPTRKFSINESKSLQYVKKMLSAKISVHAKINLAKIDLHKNQSPCKELVSVQNSKN